MTRSTRRIAAPPSRVYRALLDPVAVQEWMVPDSMTSQVHWFDPREGGTFRISLTYDAPTTAGKTSDQEDTFQAHLVTSLPNTRPTMAHTGPAGGARDPLDFVWQEPIAVARPQR